MKRFIACLGLCLFAIGRAEAQGFGFVDFSPKGKIVAGTTQVTITIKWCGFGQPDEPYMDINTRSIEVNGVNVTGNFDLVSIPGLACGFTGNMDDETFFTSTGTVTVSQATGIVDVQAEVSNGVLYFWGETESYSPPAPRRAVTVTARQQFMSPPPSTARGEGFTIQNAGAISDSYSLSVTGCSSGAVATACSLNPAGPVTVPAGGSVLVYAHYTSSGTVNSTGLIRVKATSTADATVKDSSWTDVTVKAVPAVGVTIVGMTPGLNDVLARDACVTIALTDDAAVECGDLRLVHALPAVRTMGTVRTPTLLYNSQHARVKPLVTADIRLSTSVAPSGNITACIKVAGANRGCSSWGAWTWNGAGNTRRVTVLGDDLTWNTGPVDFTLEVTVSDASQGPYITTGRLLIVNRQASSFGAGWWLAGLEELKIVSATELMWMGGDGSARRYVKSGTVWRAPNFTALDSIQAAGTGYVRRTAEHARVYFSGAGRHDSTVNSLRHVTKFTYTGSQLTTIHFPTVGGFLNATLVYNGSGQLDSVITPGSRVARVFHTAARVDSIRDADGKVVRYTSGGALNQYVVTQRKDRRGNTTTFSLDIGNRISGATRPLASNITISLAETKAVTPPQEVDSVFTQVDGPRDDAADITRFWINGYGAPTRIRNAIGQETFIRYNATWPGLADSVRAPSRLVTKAIYNARGLVTQVRTIQPLGSGADAVTDYQWHTSLNRPTSVRTVTTGTAQLVDSLFYNADSTMAWTQRGTGSAPTRVQYTYNPTHKLPATLVLPGGHTTTFSYGALGNLEKERTPLGFYTLTYQDDIGRDTLVLTPRRAGIEATDSNQVKQKGLRQRTWFDIASRDSVTRTIGPLDSIPNGRRIPSDTIVVSSTYDAEGNRLTVTRSYTKKLDETQGGLFSANPSVWTYDALNRVTSITNAGTQPSTFTLDKAGNATSTLTPRGHTILASYDALNRVTRRVVPQETHGNPLGPCHYTITGQGCAYSFPTMETQLLCVAVDTLRFVYDGAGNLRSAENNWAKVRRAYTPSGLLTHDTLITRRYETYAPGPCGGADKHALAEGLAGFASDWTQHVYALRYEYDLAGRRTKLYHPDQLDPCSGSCIQTYGYHTVRGTLDTLVHPNTNGGTLTTRFTYDDQLRPLTTVHPGGITITRHYDNDGRIDTRSGSLTNETLGYDAAGRVISGTVSPPTGPPVALTFGYGGMGHLQYAAGTTTGASYEEFKTDALGNRLWVRDPEVVDGIDRTKYHDIWDAPGYLGGSTLGSGTCAPGGAPQGSCHPAWYIWEHFQHHDPSGNVRETWGFDTRGTFGNLEGVPEESRRTYDAQERLVYFDRHFGFIAPSKAEGMFEEYRYDALGRRVYMRSRRPASCVQPCEAYVQRAVWDGDQVLYEIRSSGRTGVDPSYMDTEGGLAPNDIANLYGSVAYAHGPGIDQPVGLLKRFAAGAGWAYVTPQANYRGEWSYGILSTGATCTSPSSTCPNFPGFQLSVDGATQGTVPQASLVFWGSVVRGTADPSGLQYLRNRYYDSKTGRFTQQDPIGLAGGLNLYGFANGDPVNFSDPFGLFQCTRDKPQNCSFKDVIRNVRSGMASVGSPGGGSDTGPGFGTGQALGLAAFVVPGGRGSGGASIADDAFVVRGGSNTPERIAAGAETIDAAGHVHGVSVNSGSGLSVLQLSRGIPHNQIGVTTAGAIRAAGGRVVPDATRVNPHHCLVSCISADALSKLLNPTIRNPAK